MVKFAGNWRLRNEVRPSQTQAAVERVRSSRLQTQIAIERSRQSLAETRSLIVALKFKASERRKQTVTKLKRH
jgi:hypothetical protein